METWLDGNGDSFLGSMGSPQRVTPGMSVAFFRGFQIMLIEIMEGWYTGELTFLP